MKNKLILTVFAILYVAILSPHSDPYASDDCYVVYRPYIHCAQESGDCSRQDGYCDLRVSHLFPCFRRYYCKCVCEDAIIHADFLTSEPIDSFPTTRTFYPTGTWMIHGLAPGETLWVTATGTMEATLSINARDSGFVTATIDEMMLQISGLPTGPNDVSLLSLTHPFIAIAYPSGDTSIVSGPCHVWVDSTNGWTNGVVGTSFKSSSEWFSFKGDINGMLDFGTGVWSWTVEGTQCPIERPVPTLTQWGLIVFAGLFILSMIFMLRRKRAKFPLGP